MRLIRLILCLIFVCVASDAQETFFSKVIIWGHPLHSHTHSYIHEAFYRAFKYLGYEVYWVSSIDEISNIDLANTLFITEGQVDKKIPKRHDCYYIVHNWNFDDYKELFQQNRCIVLQVYTHDCLPYVTEKLDDYIYCNTREKMIFMPWATDLLPHEIDVIKHKKLKRKRLKHKKAAVINWVGTIGGGRFGNNVEIDGFRKACSENNITFNHVVNASMKKTI